MNVEFLRGVSLQGRADHLTAESATRSPGAAHQLDDLSFPILPPRFGVRPSFGLGDFFAGLALALFTELRPPLDLVGRCPEVATVAVAESITLVLTLLLLPLLAVVTIHHSGQEKTQAESSAT